MLRLISQRSVYPHIDIDACTQHGVIADPYTVAPGARLMVFSDGVFTIEKDGDRFGTCKEFVESLAASEVRDLCPQERYARALRDSARDSLEDDFSLVEFQFD